jgi:hypothetical protein
MLSPIYFVTGKFIFLTAITFAFSFPVMFCGCGLSCIFTWTASAGCYILAAAAGQFILAGYDLLVLAAMGLLTLSALADRVICGGTGNKNIFQIYCTARLKRSHNHKTLLCYINPNRHW